MMDPRSTLTALVSLGLLLVISSAEAKKILLIGYPFTSHMNELLAVSRGLLPKGHEVYVVMDINKIHEKRFQGTGVKFLTYDSLDKEQKAIEKFEDEWQELCFRNPRLTKRQLLVAMTDFLRPLGTNECERILGDEKLLQNIRELKFDIALLDSIYFCSYLIPHKLGIPYVSVGTFTHVWKQRLHPVASQVPCEIERDNSLYNRMLQFILGYVVESTLPTIFFDESKFANYAKEKPYDSLYDLVANSSLFIINQNSVGSCAAPSMPNVIYVGGLTTKPTKPLNDEYTKIADSAKDGFIVMSFGSGMAKMPKEFVRKFLWAFSQIKQTVIWKLKTTYDLEVPSNVRIVDWMPQNDLLGHDNIRLFIAHGGNNGQYEALYHGVPMIGCPLYGDQDDNINRMEHKGFGLQIQIATFTAEELLQKIREVIGNPKYRANMKRASKIHRSLRDPVEESVFWIEHVMEHGSAHLRSVLSEMNAIQFLLLDVFAVFLVLALLVLFLSTLLIGFVSRKIFGAKPSNIRAKKQN